MRISSSEIVVLSLIFAIVLSLSMLTVTKVVLSKLGNAAEKVDGILLPTDNAQVLQAYLDSNYTPMISPETPYEHVILIVVDGVRPDILVGANTPSIDNLTASGSFTWNAWTVTPSVTIAAIPSIYTGATPEVHGVTDWHGEIHAETIVEVFENAGLHCAIVGEDPILGGYSATYCTGYYSHPHPDENFMSTAINLLRENDFYFISIYNPVPDGIGHSYGHDSPEYREAIENADYHIGRLVENLKELGVYDNTLIVITTDHGRTGTSHGHGYETDMRIFSVWHGPGVKQGYEMADSVYIPASGTYDETYVAHRIIDIAPTIAELVGVRPPENAEGEIIGQIFEGALTPHDPIYIEGNDNFIPANGVVGGSGTENDPYIIKNYIIDASTANGIEIRNTTVYFVVRNCVVKNGGSYYEIVLYNVTCGKIENNTCENSDIGIYLESSSNNIITSNTCPNNRYGIWLDSSDNSIIENNIIENCSDTGISLGFSDNNLISNNIVRNNRYEGIFLEYCGYNLISNNIVENGIDGIYFWKACDNNSITNNIIRNNGTGMELTHWPDGVPGSPFYNIISNNLVENNNTGISLDGYYNKFYHNNFMNINNHASAWGPNYWDNGYPSGGNYWSDYTGVDETHGENQDIPGSDGIGDTPYIIPGDNTSDRYPLMNLWPIAEGMVMFKLENLYAVSLEKDLQLYIGSKLVVKFYDYANNFESEVVIENITPPQSVVENENVPHPSIGSLPVRTAAKKAELVLTTDNTENVISTIASFTVHQSDLRNEYIILLMVWAANPELQPYFRMEIMDKLKMWASAPP